MDWLTPLSSRILTFFRSLIDESRRFLRARNESVNCYVSSTVSYIVAAYVRHIVAVACFTKPFRFLVRETKRDFSVPSTLFSLETYVPSRPTASFPAGCIVFEINLKRKMARFGVVFTEIFLIGDGCYERNDVS